MQHFIYRQTGGNCDFLAVDKHAQICHISSVGKRPENATF